MQLLSDSDRLRSMMFFLNLFVVVPCVVLKIAISKFQHVQNVVVLRLSEMIDINGPVTHPHVQVTSPKWSLRTGRS